MAQHFIKADPNKLSLAIKFVESCGFKVIKQADKWDITDLNLYAMIEVQMYGPRPMLDHYRPSPINDHFAYGNELFFLEWARKLYRHVNPK